MTMTPEESFDHQLLLAIATMTGHLVRCADQADILDGVAKKSIRAHFMDLSEAAVRLDRHQVLAWVDMLARTLPPFATERKGDPS